MNLKPSRAMLSGELSWASVALVLAWNGLGVWPFESSYLHRVLEKHDYDDLWLYVVLLPALWTLIASGYELFSNRKGTWEVDRHRRIATCRKWASGGMLFCWFYIAWAAYGMGRIGLLFSLAVIGFLFALWFVVENRRVQREYR